MGKKYTGPEAKDAGIVHELLPETELLDRAVAIAEEYADKDYNDTALQQLKVDYYHHVSKVLLSGPVNFSEL